MADSPRRAWLLRHVTGPTAGRTALLLAAALALPFCSLGLLVDDYFHQLLLEQHPKLPGTAWELFTFASGDPARVEPIVTHGPYPWWTLPTLRLSFWRPLSVALANADHLLFGRAFVLHHLHSLAWYLVLVAVVTALLKRALGAASPLAALGAVLFAMDDAHALVVGWLANRNALISTVPVLLGLLAHVRWREQGVRAGLPLSIVCFAVGLAGGESALGALAYLLAYELTAAPGPWRARALALLPVAALGVLYVGVYRAVGAGAFGSGIYVDPMREPLLFLAQAPPKALALVGALLLGSTADLWLLLQPARPALVLAGVLALLLVGALLRRLWPALEAEERRGLRWLGLGSALSLIPVLATFPLNRLLLMPSVGGSAVLAAALWHGWRAAHDRFARLGARLLFLTTVVLGLLGWAGAWGVMRIGGDEQIRTAMETRLSEEALAGEVFLLVAPDPVTAIYLPLVRLWNGRPLATTWITLSFAPCAHRLTRTAPDTLELEVLDGRMLETVFEQLLRSPAFPIAEGATVRLSGATLTVVHLDRALPQRIRVQFDAPLEGGAVTVAWFEHGTLAPFPLPAVGQSVELPNIALF